MTSLCRASLPDLGRRVAVPGYDVTAVRPGIAHVGVGGFHRAHQAVYVDELLGRGLADWGIVGIGVLRADAAMRDALAAQDHLYTVVVTHPDGTRRPRVVGSLTGYVFAPDDPGGALAVLTDPGIRIVSLTITEGGYHLDQGSGALELDGALRADLCPGAVPRTAFGFIVEALARRRAAGTRPFTVMSCDNIEANGDLARAALAAFARLRDPGLGEWIAGTVAFPNSMVDRITPATTGQDRAALAAQFGVDDAWPVVCEPFRQWVLQDDFPAGRPPLESAGVHLVSDVRPYELMKLRLLNGGHQALGHLGRLAGHRYVHEAAQDPLIAGFLRGYLEHEAIPSLDPVPGVDLTCYRDELLSRFANPHVRDTLDRICTDTSDRIPKFVLPVVQHRLALRGQVRRCALIVAAWARGAEGVDDGGHPIPVSDRRRDWLIARARHNRDGALAFLADEHLFGALGREPAFAAAYAEAVRSLHAVGVRETLRRWTEDHEER